MKKILALAAGCFAFMSCAPAFAAWQEIGFNDQVTIYVDPETIKKTDGDNLQILSMLDLKTPGKDPKTDKALSSIIGLNEFACGKQQYRPLEVKLFTGNKGGGSLISDEKLSNSPYEQIVSGSWVVGVYKTACGIK
ncbi:hypothetical protein LZG75_09685 [Polynucleobacter sp. IMCC30063]|uniref:surface-adhesin E family protein n=1 Tax=unclassified Polynucleobacter TaxID=2640945 RepID=UPI001F2B18DE|nr:MULTISPECIES: surface-adhesin E family protein [unclassified Polynucleobacter]MCE7506508.1 hypothetical protein [Polynucleobacter sp. IMCC30063]MCE7527780.1 hypothetical protein [Polynucleobacter sp. IMCC 30228]